MGEMSKRETKRAMRNVATFVLPKRPRRCRVPTWRGRLGCRFKDGVNLTPQPPLHKVERGSRAQRDGGEVRLNGIILPVPPESRGQDAVIVGTRICVSAA